MIRDSKQLQIGKAGEYLVCADLILKGFIAWEGGNALYLQKQMEGKIVTPDSIEAFFVKHHI